MTTQDITYGNPPFIMQCLTIPEWRAYVSEYDFGPVAPSRVVLHHTWSPTLAQWRGAASMRGMQGYYASLGWHAAPHIYAAPDGIWLATPISQVGIHAGHGNSGVWGGEWSYSIGLEMVGNYDSGKPSGVVWQNTLAVITGLMRRLNIPVELFVWFHRDFSSKSCPGYAVTKKWVQAEVISAIGKPIYVASNNYRIREGIDFAAVRTAQTTLAPEATIGVNPVRLPPGYEVTINTFVTGQEIAGDDQWGHIAEPAPWGFVHNSLLVPATTPLRPPPVIPITPDAPPLLSEPRAEEQAIAKRIKEMGRLAEYTPGDIDLIMRYYWHYAPLVGVDPFIAVAQCMHETDYLRSWWAARPRRNPAGLGVTGETSNSMPPEEERDQWVQKTHGWAKGLSFPTWEDSVQAHIGHLLKYALPDDEMTIQQHAMSLKSPRDIPLSYRGSARTIKGLTGRWATDPDYDKKIARVANRLQNQNE